MKTLSSILWLIFSLLTIVVGIGGLLIPLEVFASLIVFLPWLLLFGAIVNVIYYFDLKKKGAGSMNLLLIDALLRFLFALIFFASGIAFTSLTVVAFIAFMAMFKGILGISYAFELKKQGLNWIWVLISSILSIIISVFFIIFPQIGGFTIGFMFAFMVLWFGMVSLFSWFEFRKLDNNSQNSAQ